FLSSLRRRGLLIIYQVLAPASVKPQLGHTKFNIPSYSIFAALQRGQIIPSRRLFGGMMRQKA
ncbi:MAG: hypothetical protein SVP52_02370, partial [Chloroflexota bacterium]|nr:hypothetical protein [Chloroflexota bacterium]